MPVLSSRATSLPEVGGDAVEYVDAERVPDLAASLLRLLDDPARRARARRGRPAPASRDSTGARTALETLASYERALSPATRA